MHTTLFDQFPREIVCRHAIRLPVDADRAWALVGNFGEARIGAVRTMYIAGSWGDGYTGGAEVYVKERLESYDESERCMTYRLVDAGPLPFADYVGSARLVCAGPERCIAVMTSAFVPVEMTDEAAAALSRGSIDLALSNLRAAAERRNAAVSA